jgi:C4-dicarboxylate-specific signal transduction histidine kinase
MFVALLLFLQAALIAGLLRQRQRRVYAELQARQRMAELAHVNRFSMAGEFTASVAHEINQPLGSIRTNAETLELTRKSHRCEHIGAPESAKVVVTQRVGGEI